MSESTTMLEVFGGISGLFSLVLGVLGYLLKRSVDKNDKALEELSATNAAQDTRLTDVEKGDVRRDARIEALENKMLTLRELSDLVTNAVREANEPLRNSVSELKTEVGKATEEMKAIKADLADQRTEVAVLKERTGRAS